MRATPQSDPSDALDPKRLLEGAVAALRKAPVCWLATAGDLAAGDQRPMGLLLNDSDFERWTLLFLTDARSRKATEIRADGAVAILAQHAPDDAFLRLLGRAVLIESAAEVAARWNDAYAAFFPGDARAHAVFVEVAIQRLELWIRGVTPEPYGLRTTIVERTGEGWRAALA